MLWTIFVILLVMWLLGLVSSYTLGGYIHILLVIAVVVLLINLISRTQGGALRQTLRRRELLQKNNLIPRRRNEEIRFAVLLSLVTLLGSMAWATAKEDSVERLQSSAAVSRKS